MRPAEMLNSLENATASTESKTLDDEKRRDQMRNEEIEPGVGCGI